MGPDYEKPLVETPETWRFTDAEASAVVNTLWWTQFEDPVLDELIDQALRANLDVRNAAARVEQFAARLNISRSDFFPQVGYGVNGDRQGISNNNAAIDNTAIITSNFTIILGAFLFAAALALGLGSREVVGDLLRTFYTRKIYEVGDKIKFDKIEGRVEAIDNITVIIKTKSGKVVVPIKKIVDNTVEVEE